jgi:hypothetical protein
MTLQLRLFKLKQETMAAEELARRVAPEPPDPQTIAVPFWTLNGYDHREQALRDRIHEKLGEQCELDAETGCWIYTGPWTEKGAAKVRVGRQVYTLHRVSAWLYRGFELWSRQVVYHTCRSPACYNPGHLAFADSQAEALAAMRKLKLFQPNGVRRFTWEQVREIRNRLAAGECPKALRRELGLKQQVALTRIADGRSWGESRGQIETHAASTALCLRSA